MWNLIVSVPDHCLFIFFETHIKRLHSYTVQLFSYRINRPVKQETVSHVCSLGTIKGIIKERTSKINAKNNTKCDDDDTCYDYGNDDSSPSSCSL